MKKRKIRISQRSWGFLWNSVAGIVNASEAVLVLMVVSRTNGLEDAGIVTIAFSVGNLMMTIGKYGMRSFQATDINDQYDFSSYFTSRIITVIGMLLMMVVYLLFNIMYNGYTMYKAFVVLVISLLYMVESMEDVFWGYFQRIGRIDIGGMIFTCRWSIHLLCICSLLLITHRLLLATLTGLILGSALSLVMNVYFLKKYNVHSFCMQIKGAGNLLRVCFPLFAVSFLSMYIVNSPKFAIDRFMAPEDQACYGFLAMPVFVIGLLNGFIYQPFLVDMANRWNERQLNDFCGMLFWQMKVLTGVTLVVLVGGYMFGIPVLSLLFSTDLSKYQLELMVLLLGGGFLALSGYLLVVLTVMRVQHSALNAYITVAVLSLLLSKWFIMRAGLLGAAELYLILIAALSLLLGGQVVREYSKVRKEYVRE